MRPHRRAVRAVAAGYVYRRGSRSRRREGPRLDETRKRAEDYRPAFWRYRRRICGGRVRSRGRVLVRGQYPRPDGKPRGTCELGAERKGDALVLDANAALPAPRAFQGPQTAT